MNITQTALPVVVLLAVAACTAVPSRSDSQAATDGEKSCTVQCEAAAADCTAGCNADGSQSSAEANAPMVCQSNCTSVLENCRKGCEK